MKTTVQVLQQNDRIHLGITNHYSHMIKQAHPQTGGSFHLAHNWGNKKTQELLTNYRIRCSRLFVAHRNAYERAFAYQYPDHLSSIRYFKTHSI